jgi:DNA-binding IclR family transcriptional regulator
MGMPRVVARTPIRERRRNAAKSAERAFDVLHYFGAEARPLRATEIRRAFHLSPSSADQLLKTLVDSAYLTFNAATKLYFPSPRLLRFATMLTRHYRGDGLLRLMSQLQAETGEKVVVVTLCDVTIQLVDSLNYGEFSGMKFDLDSVAGHVLLGQFAPAAMRKTVERAVLLRRCKRENAAALVRAGSTARDSGYAAGRSLVIPECWTLSVPLPGKSSDVPLALSLIGETGRIQRNMNGLIATMLRHVRNLTSNV